MKLDQAQQMLNDAVGLGAVLTEEWRWDIDWGDVRNLERSPEVSFFFSNFRRHLSRLELRGVPRYRQLNQLPLLCS